MNQPIYVAPRACSTCPYRRDVAPGIWDASEYEKLRAFDNPGISVALVASFHCHQQTPETPTLCRGWLSVHRDSVGVRLLMATGRLNPADVPMDAEPYLYTTGTEACEAGLAGVDAPGETACREVSKLMRRKGTAMAVKRPKLATWAKVIREVNSQVKDERKAVLLVAKHEAIVTKGIDVFDSGPEYIADEVLAAEAKLNTVRHVCNTCNTEISNGGAGSCACPPDKKDG